MGGNLQHNKRIDGGQGIYPLYAPVQIKKVMRYMFNATNENP